MNSLKRFILSLLSLTIFTGTFFTSTIIYASDTVNTKTGITIRTCDIVTNQPLTGIGIKVENITAGQYKDYGTIISDSNGNIILDNISVGWYRITEVSTIKGYILNSTPITRYFDNSEVMHNITISNKPQQALNILKIDTETGKGLEGAVFEIRNSNNALIATETTGINGYAVISYIEPGSYTVTEIQAPNGYDRDTTPQTIQINSSESNPYILVFGNHEYSSLCIRKTDLATGQPLANTHFKITLANGTSVINDIVTDTNGFAIIKNISAGTYKIFETQAPDGYIKDLKTAEVTFGVNKENKLVNITNSRPGGIIVHSADTSTGKPLAGTKLKLYNKDNILLKDNIITDNNGMAAFSDLESGTYTVVASSPTEGYILDTSALTIKVKANEISEITFTSTIQPSILIKSIDSKTGLALPNTAFELRKIDGTIIGNYVTGSDGSVTIPNCDVGYYLVEETKAPDGYVLTTASQSIYTKKGELSVVTFTNRAKPYISIDSVIKGSNLPLAGASFELYTLGGKLIQ